MQERRIVGSIAGFMPSAGLSSQPSYATSEKNPFRVAAVTIASKSRLALARVTARSFLEHNPGIPFYVLLADEVEGCFDPALEPFHLIGMDQLGLRELVRLRFQYTEMELSFALTPCVIEYLLNSGFDGVIFLKQETLVLDGLEPVVEKLREHSVLLTPHLLGPGEGDDAREWEINVLRSGMYNGGFIGFSRREDSIGFLSWWKEKTAWNCFWAVETGIHYEQRWLDFVPAFVPGFHIIRDPGMNVGHWNLLQRRVGVQADGQVTANGSSCRVFRFSGYDPDRPGESSRYHSNLTLDQAGDASVVFERYRSLLMKEGYEETRRWPYTYEHFDNGVRVPVLARRIYHDLENPLERFGDPFCTEPAGSFYRWLNAGADGEGSIPNFWRGVHRRRPDLIAAFGDLRGEQCTRYEDWIRTSGIQECGSLQLPGLRG
ncbi:MAG: hypothetical protein WCH43_04190 [Verrucomicrobiota bacterium]